MRAIYSYSILQSNGIYIALIFQNDELTLQKKISRYTNQKTFFIYKNIKLELTKSSPMVIVVVAVVVAFFLCTDLNSMDNDPNSSFDS